MLGFTSVTTLTVPIWCPSRVRESITVDRPRLVRDVLEDPRARRFDAQTVGAAGPVCRTVMGALGEEKVARHVAEPGMTSFHYYPVNLPKSYGKLTARIQDNKLFALSLFKLTPVH